MLREERQLPNRIAPHALLREGARVPGEHDASAAPPQVPPCLWSANSQQIIVENSSAEGNSRVILVDLASAVAAVVAQGARPEGWLSEP